jgi:hypothetical protein
LRNLTRLSGSNELKENLMAIIIPHPSSAVRTKASRAEQLFQELDNRQIAAGPNSWTARVFAVHSVNAEEWVQVAPIGQPSRSLILRFSREVRPTQAVAALKTWTRIPERARPGIADVLTLLHGPAEAA